MAATISGFPYAEVQFDRSGQVIERDSLDALVASLGTDPCDVLVLVHGWNNDMQQARDLYERLAERFRAVRDGSPPVDLGERRFVIVGALWPSRRWAERTLIPGGAASGGGDADDEDVQQVVSELMGVFDSEDADDRLRSASELIPYLADSTQARDRFVDAVRGVLASPADGGDEGDYDRNFASLSGSRILEFLEPPSGQSTPGGTPGGAAGLFHNDDNGQPRSFFTGPKAAAERFLNLTTYYQMKQRAGLVGTRGLAPVLRGLKAEARGAKLHLVGHSFGGRLVTACTLGEAGAPPVQPDTLSLLQAAFSHYGFAKDYEVGKSGFFRRVVTDKMTSGPVVITHSIRDLAVGYAYPLASRLRHQIAAALGDPMDPYGGIGRNGARYTPEAGCCTLGRTGEVYPFAAHQLLNLSADDIIRDHSDICHDEVAYAILAAVAAVP